MAKRNASDRIVVQADDPVFGSWAIAQRGDASGTVYRFDGRGWVPSGSATWNAARGRFELDAPVVDQTRRALNETALSEQGRLKAVKEYLNRLDETGFRGTRTASETRKLSTVGDLAYRSMRRVRCLSNAEKRANQFPLRSLTADQKAVVTAYLAADPRQPVDKSAATFRKIMETNLFTTGLTDHDARLLIQRLVRAAPRGKSETLDPQIVKVIDALFRDRYVSIERDTPGRTKWYRRLDGEVRIAREVSRAIMGELCDSPTGSVEPGSECDLALDAIEQEPEPTGECAAIEATCPHRISGSQRTEWRIGGMPALGPYETTEPHAVGTIACCWYHPVSQARLALQSQIGNDSESPYGTRAWIDAVRRAEQSHPLYPQWMACDSRAEEEVGGLPTGRGAATAGVMQLLKAFVQAHDADNFEEGIAIFGRLEPLITLHSGFDEMWALDADFWDVAHLEAHELGNPGHILWAHQQMKARGQTIHHARQAKRKRNGGKAMARDYT